MTNEKTDAVRRELLTYLADYPSLIERGHVTLGDLALDLGKALTWISGSLDGPDPVGCESIGQSAQSIESLGKQFQAAGLIVLNGKNPVGKSHARQFAQIAAEMSALSARVNKRKGGVL